MKIIRLLFRYIFFSFILLSLISGLLIIEKSIPNYRVRDNIIKSEKYYNDYFRDIYSNMKNLKDRHTMIDIPTDFTHLSILYFEDYKHPIKNFIEMNYDSKLPVKIVGGKKFKDMEADSNYARYWQGQIILLKPLLTFFTMGTIYNIYFVMLIITFLILILNLLNHSKLLAIIFSLGAVSINLFFMSKCNAFFQMIMICLISSIMIIKMYENNSKNIDLLFLGSGIITACFDNLSCETLSLTLPLFIYIYLHLVDKKKFVFKDLFKYIVLWGFGYGIAFIFKWALLVIHYKGKFIDYVLKPMSVRIGTNKMSRLEIFRDSISLVPHYLVPFYFDSIKYIMIVLGIVSFIYLLFDNKRRKYYLGLLVICSIPFIRYFVLGEHSNYHNYFTYRCFLVVVMFLLLSILLVVNKIVFKHKKKNLL